MNWNTITLHDAASISSVVNVYEVKDLRVPGAKYKIKTIERADKDFLALPNLGVKNNVGIPDWTAGLGRTEIEALQDALFRLDEAFKTADRLIPEDFEWSVPRDS
nr:hypothetical protein [Myxococcaceae bacterium MCy9487]